MKANDIRKGVVIMYNKSPHRVMDFHHHTPGNLRAMVQTKLRNLLSGNQTEVRFSSTEELEEADVLSTKATYLYSDSTGNHFMLSDSYEQISIVDDVLADAKYYLQEQMEVDVLLYMSNPISVGLPATVVLTIAETEPELKGATASNSPKPAKTDTGLQLSVPPFIKEGERIVVGTADGKYISRAE
jgi:elongation factor P